MSSGLLRTDQGSLIDIHLIKEHQSRTGIKCRYGKKINERENTECQKSRNTECDRIQDQPPDTGKIDLRCFGERHFSKIADIHREVEKSDQMHKGNIQEEASEIDKVS